MGTHCADHVTPLYQQKLALTSPTKAMEFQCAYVGRNYSNLIVMHGMENVKNSIRCVKCDFEISVFKQNRDSPCEFTAISNNMTCTSMS